MSKYVFNRKLPKASLIRVRKIAYARESRFFLKMRGANFLQLYVGPFDVCIRMPWLSGAAHSLHPELFRGAAMITRAQAEALLTLAESLEACERLGFHLGASMAQGCGIVELTQDTNYLDTELTAVDVRLIVSDLMPKQEKGQ